MESASANIFTSSAKVSKTFKAGAKVEKDINVLMYYTKCTREAAINKLKSSSFNLITAMNTPFMSQ